MEAESPGSEMTLQASKCRDRSAWRLSAQPPTPQASVQGALRAASLSSRMALVSLSFGTKMRPLAGKKSKWGYMWFISGLLTSPSRLASVGSLDFSS